MVNLIDPEDARHQTRSNLEALWTSGYPQVLPMSGVPWCEIRLDPAAGEAVLRTEYRFPEPDIARLRNVVFSAAVEDGRELALISASVDENIHSVYGLLTTIADGLQGQGLDLATAVAVAVEEYRDVMAQRVGLSEQVEVGLFGELLFLRHLISKVGAAAAVGSWLGPLSEEHDFVLPNLHVEVKTTVSERRRHMISGLFQLVPLGNVPLSLMSIQVTRATPDSGQMLPSLIAEIRTSLGPYGPDFEVKLRRQGWEPDDADLFRTTWNLRTAPQAYQVDEDFPAMTQDRVAAVVPNVALVSDVTYRVDVTDLQPEPLPSPYDGFDTSEGIGTA